jgi:hypothetical protein
VQVPGEFERPELRLIYESYFVEKIFAAWAGSVVAAHASARQIDLKFIRFSFVLVRRSRMESMSRDAYWHAVFL